MSSQALIAENLRQKDSERSLVEERIQELRVSFFKFDLGYP